MSRRLSLTKHYGFDNLVMDISCLQPGMKIKEVQRTLSSPHKELSDDIFQYDEDGRLLDSVLLQVCRDGGETALRVLWVSLVAADTRLPIVLRAMSRSDGKLNGTLYATSKIEALLIERVQVNSRKAASNLAHYFEQARIFVPRRHGSEIVGAESVLNAEGAVPLCITHLAEVLAWENPLKNAVDLGVHIWLNISESRFKELANGDGSMARPEKETARQQPIAVPPNKPDLDLPYRRQAETSGIAAPRVVRHGAEARENATKEHRKTQNALAEWAKKRGLETVRPDGAPEFDVGWWILKNTFVVAEVKSLGADNEARQVRLGIGQILDYRKQLRDVGIDANAVLVVSRKPASEHWVELAKESDITFSWPPFVELDRRFLTGGQ